MSEWNHLCAQLIKPTFELYNFLSSLINFLRDDRVNLIENLTIGSRASCDKTVSQINLLLVEVIFIHVLLRANSLLMVFER